MPNKKRIAIVGATSAIAEQCARQWTQAQDCELLLIGRNLERLNQLAADIQIRAPQSAASTYAADFNSPDSIQALVESVFANGPIDIVLIAHGTLPDQKQCQSNLQVASDALDINGRSPALFAEAFAQRLEQAGQGTLALIGSVAGDRGRKSNYVYGAAKGLVTRYAQGLQHRFAGSNIKIVLVKPGPTDTPMTAHLKAHGAKLASSEAVARRIIRGIQSGKPLIYAPGKWALIMLIIRHLPRFIFNKMDI